MSDRILDALLAEYAPPAPSDGLVSRVVMAALALPQEPGLANGHRLGALPRRDRRGKWLRRPLLIGGVAIGLAVTSAVAATLAGVRLDRLPGVEAILERLPFGGDQPASETAPPPRPAPAPAAQPLPVAEPAPAREGPALSRNMPEPAVPRVSTRREEVLPIAAPEEAPQRPDVSEIRRIDLPPAPVTLPPPAARQEEAGAAPRPLPPPPPPAALGPQRAQREQVERAERLRAARQAQIERLQRVQQSRERIRRLRRD